MSKPLFLLDIDGVTNAFDGWVPTQDVEPFINKAGQTKYRRIFTAPEGYREGFAAGYSLLLNKSHPEWLREVEAAGFDMVWATMWQDRAASAFAPVAGFGHDWDHIDFHSFQPAGAWHTMTGAGVGSYKWPGITEVLGDAPGIWVDDDMEPWQHEWAEKRTAAGIPTLFIQPETNVGMTREHVDMILAFAASLRRTEPVA